MDSGGPIMPEQSAYNVTYYDFSIKVMPDSKSIEGKVEMVAKVVQPMFYCVMDLDLKLDISKIEEITELGLKERAFHREMGKVWISLDKTRQPGESIDLRVFYSGRPRIAKHPPWSGGLSWEKTQDGSDWIATTCQGEGADIWWPCKDHVSDEPDSMRFRVNVPAPLVAAGNGKLEQLEKLEDGTNTYNWFISNPINIYNVSLNIAPYVVLEETMDCIDGTTYPVMFYVLPEDKEKGEVLMKEILDHLRFFERNFGPYPFRSDKYGVAQTPHLGMEHQSIIAYGANFDNGSMTGGIDWGFDALHHHELSHEWWGNMVTCADWKDMWIHEGFGTYTQAVYLEETQGKESYFDYMRFQNIRNNAPVAPRESTSADEIWKSSIYAKGSRTLHALRYVVGWETLKRSMRLFAYPDPAKEKISDGSQCRFVDTEDFITLIEELSGKDLDWFFEMYLRQTELPDLYSKQDDKYLTLEWKTPDDLYWPMPVEVKVDGRMYIADLSKGPGKIKVKKKSQVSIDPNGWLMFNHIED